MLTVLLGALVATAAPTAPPSVPKTVIMTPAPKRDAVPDLTAMLAMFDTMFPPQPEPDPARLPMAHSTALARLPPGILAKSVTGSMGGLFDRVMAMREGDLPGMKPAVGGASSLTLRQSLNAKDPHFDERARLTRAAMEAEFARFSAVIEPRMRDGIARVIARRFDQRQLTDINTFFATPTGKALGSQFLGMWFEPDLMRSTVTAMPDMIRLVPGSLERIQAATAHLPKPPQPTPPAKPKRPPAKGKTPAK